MKDRVRLAVSSGVDIVTARALGRELAAQAGFNGSDLTVIATAISELARNIVEYAHSGEIILSVVQDRNRIGIRVEAHDNGPGIADIDLAMRDGYSTGGGLGLGLPGTRRMMDDFRIDSKDGAATTVTATKWIR